MNTEKIKNLLKSKIVWLAATISILGAIGNSNPALFFLSTPFAMTVLAAFPAAIAIACSPRFIEKFVILHKWRHQHNGSYKYATMEIKTPSVWKFALRTTLYSFAILCNIFSFTGMFDTISENANRVIVLLIALSIPSLFTASVINVAIFLLTKSGLMFENKEDNSRINLGREMYSRMDWAVSPVIFTTLIYPLITKTQIMSYVLLTLAILFAFCFYAAIVSFYLLRKFQIERLVVNVKRRLNRIFPILGS